MVCRLSSCDAWALKHVGSVVAVHGLSCPAACGILVPRPGIKPPSPALEGRFLTTGPPGKSPICKLFLKWRVQDGYLLVRVDGSSRSFPEPVFSNSLVFLFLYQYERFSFSKAVPPNLFHIMTHLEHDNVCCTTQHCKRMEGFLLQK